MTGNRAILMILMIFPGSPVTKFCQGKQITHPPVNTDIATFIYLLYCFSLPLTSLCDGHLSRQSDMMCHTSVLKNSVIHPLILLPWMASSPYFMVLRVSWLDNDNNKQVIFLRISKMAGTFWHGCKIVIISIMQIKKLKLRAICPRLT